MTFDRESYLHFREICPKDFYFAQLLRNKDESMLPLLLRTLKNPEELDNWTMSQAQSAIEWASEELLTEKVFSVEDWLTTAFHLCKQRWGPEMDWLETQPMSKVLTMVSILEDFAKAQNPDK